MLTADRLFPLHIRLPCVVPVPVNCDSHVAFVACVHIRPLLMMLPAVAFHEQQLHLPVSRDLYPVTKWIVRLDHRIPEAAAGIVQLNVADWLIAGIRDCDIDSPRSAAGK